MTLQEILDLLNQGGSAGSGPAGAASIASNQAGQLGAFGGAELGNLFGINSNNSSAQLGGQIGGEFGLIGGLLGDLIGGWIGGGIPRGAKTSALGGALQQSGNPLDALIGQFVTKGAGQGRVLSESGSSTFGQSNEDLTAFLEALTGQQAPSVTATGFQHNPTFTPPSTGQVGDQFKLPAGYNFLDPSHEQDAAKIIERIVGMQQPMHDPKVSQGEWQKVVQQLIGAGDLTKYQGPLGAVGATPTSPGAIPNLSLPHPLAPNQPQITPSPYPLTAGA